MDIRPREKIKIDMETYQENWAGDTLHTQKLLSRGLEEKLVNTVFKIYTLYVKIKALKVVDGDRIWLKYFYYFLLVAKICIYFV